MSPKSWIAVVLLPTCLLVIGIWSRQRDGNSEPPTSDHRLISHTTVPDDSPAKPVEAPILSNDTKESLAAAFFSVPASDFIARVERAAALAQAGGIVKGRLFWLNLEAEIADSKSMDEWLIAMKSIPDGTLRYLLEAKDSRSQSVMKAIIGRVTGSVNRNDAPGYAAKVDDLPESSPQEKLVKSLWTAAMVIDRICYEPATGLAIVKTLEEPLRRDVEGPFVRNLALVDASAAAQHFLSSDYVGDTDHVTYDSVLYHFSANDPGALSQVIRDAPDSTRKDAASAFLALRIAAADPNAARAWAESVRSATLREETLIEVNNRAAGKKPSTLRNLFGG